MRWRTKRLNLGQLPISCDTSQAMAASLAQAPLSTPLQWFWGQAWVVWGFWQQRVEWVPPTGGTFMLWNWKSKTGNAPYWRASKFRYDWPDQHQYGRGKRRPLMMSQGPLWHHRQPWCLTEDRVCGNLGPNIYVIQFLRIPNILSQMRTK